MENYFEEIKKLISETEKNGILLPVKGLSGYSGKKIIGVLQRFAQFKEIDEGSGYLEIGVFQGLTLLSVARALKNAPAFGVDNFSQFDIDGKNQNIVLERIAANNIKNAFLINMDFEEALLSLEGHLKDTRIGLYFVDGPHDYRSQLLCLEFIKPYLSERAIIIVDDSNYRHVRQANHDFLINNPQFKLFYEAYTDQHPQTMDEKKRVAAENGWWNGVNIIVKDSENILDPMFPPVLKDRELYFNEHILHSSKYAELSPESLRFVTNLINLKIVKAAKSLVKILQKFKCSSYKFRLRDERLNTYSGSLPEINLNPSLKNQSKEFPR